jgi:hypothetical protein
MAWDPSVLRKYSTTSHFRLLNQVRTELKSSPLPRNEDGELRMTMGRRGGSLRSSMEGRPRTAGLPQSLSAAPAAEEGNADSTSFRDRLRAIDMR